VNAPTGEPRPAPASADRALAVVVALGALGALDRAALASVLESLRADLWLTDAGLGALVAATVLASVAAAPLLATLSGRRAPARLLGLGVAVSGAATMLSAAARGPATLLAARAAAGLGRAADSTVAPALAPEARETPGGSRRRIAAVAAGAALGYVLGGVASRLLGWRAALVAAGAPALLLALACLRLPGPPGGAPERTLPPPGEGGLAAAARALRADRPRLLAVLGQAAATFAAGALAFWTPSFLERTRGVPRIVAAVELGVIVVMAGLGGPFAGGLAAERLRRRTREANLWVAGLAALAAAPLALAAFVAWRPGAYLVALVLALLLVFAAAGPASAAVAAATPAGERAGAAALGALAVRLLAEAPAPALVGLVSDRTSLGRALAVLVPAALLLAGAAWTSAAWRRERAARGSPAPGP
jgi:predicted MFS family arabinose efflux permease